MPATPSLDLCSAAFRWYYYYFLSVSLGDFLGPCEVFPACTTGPCGMPQVWQDTFSHEAYGSHAICTW